MAKKNAPPESGPSKKERKRLAERAAKLAAEIAEREAAAKKVKTTTLKSGKIRVDDIPEPTVAEVSDAEARPAPTAEAIADAKAARAAKRAQARGEVLDAEGVKSAVQEDTDAAIRARVDAKRATRAELDEAAKTLDRSDADAVRAHNAQAVLVGATLLTSDDEKATMDAAASGVEPEPEPFEMDMVAEVVETDRGREIAVGPVDAADEFAKPSEAPLVDFAVNGNGQYKIFDLEGKERPYTRVTTYIGCLEDTTMLTKWKLRVALEGVAAIDGPEGVSESVIARVNDLAHNRDIAITKARKADRKGKLGHGQLAAITTAAWSTFKRGLDAIADEAFEVGGGREKAAKGTEIHDLCAIAVKDGIDAVGDMLTDGKITPADLADVEAFLGALQKLDAKVVEVERVVVIDELKVAGRLDYVLMVKLPGMLRSSRVVADLKTGRVDLGAGKIAMQLGMYSDGIGYDLNTHEREDLKLSRTKALLFHLPAGSGECTVHVVDLGTARRGNKLAGEVRAWRNEGKRAIDLKTNILDVAPATE